MTSFTHRRLLRRSRGHTLVETSIASGVLVVMLAVAFPVFDSIADAGDEGTVRMTAQAENQQCLLKMASELQNSSTSATDDFGVPRLSIGAGEAPRPIVDVLSKQVGGFKGTLGTWSWNASAPSSTAYTKSGDGSGSTGSSSETYAKGAGDYGGSRKGRIRSTHQASADRVGDIGVRPRHKSIALNSELTFQKVRDYTVGADGSPEIVWGTPITYRVVDRKLVRVQNGEERVLAPFVVGFRAELSDTGTVIMTLVSQKQASKAATVAFHANQIEVSPKN